MATTNVSITSQTWTLATNETSSFFAIGTANNRTPYRVAFAATTPGAGIIGFHANPGENLIFASGTYGQKMYVYNESNETQSFVLAGAV